MKIRVWRGDITKLEVDAIVNAANSSLLGGSGVDGAIHRAAGPGLFLECIKLAGCKTGQSKVTKGHKLPAKHIIHTVGPVWRGGEHGERELLASCYRSSLDWAERLGVCSVAFPAISTGIFRFPIDVAASIAVATVRSHAPIQLKEVILVAYDDSLEVALTRSLAVGAKVNESC